MKTPAKAFALAARTELELLGHYTLSRNRAGQHSIRINDQWRVCFVWDAGHAWQVEIVDYH
ncbi:hypothetical protein G5B41_03525 [bacterium SGD-2]|nr:hypothetical protein [bacterium SGD-2]